MAYFGLFLLALGAATLLPLQSEAGLVALLLTGEYNVAALLLVAIAGNTLGSTINWWLGRELVRFQSRRWFPVSPAQLLRAQGWYQRYGRWSLLLSWLLVLVAKSGRYLVLAVLVL